MSQMRFSEFAVFFDDGGVMNNNRIRGLQFQKLVAEYFSPKFGGEHYMWAEGNVNFIDEIVDEFTEMLCEEIKVDYKTYQLNFITRWVESMFNHVGIKLPPKSEYKVIYQEAMEYITPNIRSSYPGVIDSIRKLKRLGFKLYTASGEDSLELKGYLQGMRVKDSFENFYGPDLINIHKTGDDFFQSIFKDAWIEPSRAIVVEDKPLMLECAQRCGANVIQACLTGEHEPSYDYYVTDMNELPDLIVRMVNNLK